MLTSAHPLITDNLLALKGHLMTRLSPVLGNLVTVVSWHVIGQHYHISRVASFLEILVLMPVPP